MTTDQLLGLERQLIDAHGAIETAIRSGNADQLATARAAHESIYRQIDTALKEAE